MELTDEQDLELPFLNWIDVMPQILRKAKPGQTVWVLNRVQFEIVFHNANMYYAHKDLKVKIKE